MTEIVKWWLILVNTAAFFLFAADKRRAVRGAWRIPEKTLFLSVLLGGGAGALLAMRLFRHKTRKALFAVGVPVVLIIEAVILAVSYYR